MFPYNILLNIKSGITPVKSRDSATLFLFNCRRWDNITRHSRHLYDIYKLLPLVPLDDTFKNLILEVRNIRATSPICPSANPNISISKLLRQIVEKQSYKTDYDTLTIGLLDEKIPYNTAITALLEIIKSNIFE